MNQSLSFKVDRQSLADVLKHAARVTEKRNTIPILSYALFTVRKDWVELTVTDLDIVLKAELPAAADVEGRLCVPFFVLKDSVGKLKGECVTVADLGNGKATLSCDATGAKVILGTMRPDDFPVMVRGDMHAEFQMDAAPFAGALATVLPFTSTEQTRYYLMGAFIHAICDQPPALCEEQERIVATLAELRELERGALDTAGPPDGRDAEAQAQLETVRERVAAETASLKARFDELEAVRCKPNVLRFATTDGHRLARVTLPLPDGAERLPDVILPTKAAKLLGHLFGKKPPSDVRIASTPTKMEFRYGRFTVLAKLIDGTFPDYSRVIPSDNAQRLTVPAPAFREAVEAVTAVASEKTRAVAVSVSKSDGVILTCSSAENGRAAVIFEGGHEFASPDDDGSLAIGFNAKYLTDILSAFPGDVSIGASDAAAPARIESPDRPELMVVLMPMRVDACVTTRADVEALSLNPWEAFQRKAANGDFAKVAQAIAATTDKGVRKSLQKALYTGNIKPAMDYLAGTGEERRLVRLRVRIELADGAGLPDARAEAMLAAYTRQPCGSMEALTFRPVQDLGAQDPAALDPAETVETEAPALAAADVVTAEPEQLPPPPASIIVDVPERQPEPAPVAAEAPVSDTPAAAHVDIVKVLTVTDQAVFVERREFENPVQRILQRYSRDGTPMLERVIHRDNIKRLVPPRNRGDRPLAVAPAAKAVPVANDGIAERLARLERIVAGEAPAAVPDGRDDRIAALEAELAERIRTNAELRSQLEAANAFGQAVTAQRDTLWRRRGCARRIVRQALKLRAERTALRAQLKRTEACLSDERATASRLAFRCDALERLSVDSNALDTAAAGRANGQPHPAIILPVSRSSARV